MDPSLCSNCNKFFGSQDGLCSKCFKETRGQPAGKQPVSENLSSVPANEESKTGPPPNPEACQFCSRKLGNIPFHCKCSYFYCSRHRLPEEHNCTYDHRAVGIRKLSEENPLVQAEKFNKLR
jgi:hypothetical protein